jgi:adenylate cyclase
MRFDYTVMGDSVNLGSRLEAANKTYGTRIIISEATREQAGDEFICRELDLVRVKGKKRPVRIFELMGNGQGTADDISEIFSRALPAYRARNWKEALGLFEEVLAIEPSDGPARLYVARCQSMMEYPPSPEWGGVHNMESK